MQQMKKTETNYKTFDELFEAVLLYDESIEKPVNEWHKGTMKSYYNYQFNTWLLNKGWNGSDESEYIKSLTKENWRKFLIDELQFRGEKKKAFEDEKLTWQVHPEKESDERFWLTTLFDEQAQTTHEYIGFKREIENHDWFNIKTENDTVKIYTPELALIFSSKELQARNMETKEDATINGFKYLTTYITAFKEGEQYFEKEFGISANTLYGANAEQYVRDIHLNFFHIPHTGGNSGWQYVKKTYPYILTHKAIKEYGFYSGIVSKVDAMIKKYPKLFQAFDKCEHDLTPKQMQPKTELKQPTKIQIKKFEDFFDKDFNEETIIEIQNKFKDYRGKKMAILIYLLQTKHKVITISNNSKTQSRKHFVSALTKENEITMQSINKVFVSGSEQLNINQKDADFSIIENELNNLLPKKVV